MLMSLLTGLANTGTASAVTANSAKLRRRELDFMRVNFLSIGIESAERATLGTDGVDTLARERVDFPQRHLLFLD